MSSNNRLAALDGLRGIAACGVVLFHAHYGPATDWMRTFVDLFFVLSGFLIGRIILSTLLKGQFSLKNFIVRRILRIWPVYYLTYLGCVAAVILNYFLHGRWEHASGIFSAPFFLQFTHHYLHFPNRAPMEDFIIWFHHSWSVAVEEQFYLLLPLILISLRNHLRLVPFLLICLIPLAVYFRAIGIFQILLIARMDALAIGVLIAAYWVFTDAKMGQLDDRSIRSHAKYVLLPLSVGFIFILMNRFAHIGFPLESKNKELMYALYFLGFNLIYGSIVHLAIIRRLGIVQKFLEFPWLIYLGAISYALYMFHMPVRGMILFVTDEQSIAEASIAWQIIYFGLSIALAALSKWLVEDPINNLKHKFPVLTGTLPDKPPTDHPPLGGAKAIS